MDPRKIQHKFLVCAIVVALSILAVGAQAQQVPIPTTPAQVPGPVPGNKMTTAYVQFVGRMAYIWAMPWSMHTIAERRLPRRPRPACWEVSCP